MTVMAPTVKGLLFDFDNTLVPSKKADFDALNEVKDKLLCALPEDEATAVMREYTRRLGLGSVDPTGLINPHEWRRNLWQKSLEILCKNAVNISAADIYSLWRSSRIKGLILGQEIRTMLEELHRKYKMAIVTNSDPTIQREKLKYCSVEEYFDAITISGEQPEAKPCASIFLTACSAIDVAPEDCVMIGDNLKHDIQGGHNAGLRATVWVRGEGEEHMACSAINVMPQDCMMIGDNLEHDIQGGHNAGLWATVWARGEGKEQQGLELEEARPDFVVDSVLGLPEVLEKLEED